MMRRAVRASVLAVSLIPSQMFADTLTAARVIRANAVIEPGDIAVSDISIPGALAAGTQLSGLEARITLYPGRPIMPTHVGPAALVFRNQPVILVYRSGGLSIAAEARALSRGGEGDLVRVMNLGSRNTVLGKVRPDGRVEVPNERLDN